MLQHAWTAMEPVRPLFVLGPVACPPGNRGGGSALSRCGMPGYEPLYPCSGSVCVPQRLRCAAPVVLSCACHCLAHGCGHAWASCWCWRETSCPAVGAAVMLLSMPCSCGTACVMMTAVSSEVHSSFCCQGLHDHRGTGADAAEQSRRLLPPQPTVQLLVGARGLNRSAFLHVVHVSVVSGVFSLLAVCMRAGLCSCCHVVGMFPDAAASDSVASVEAQLSCRKAVV